MLSPGAWVEGWLVERGHVGLGAQAYVLPARHGDGRRAALKVLRAELRNDATALARMGVERAALEAVRHPAVVELWAHGDLPTGQSWLALEWLEGEPLRRRLERGPVSLGELTQLVSALGGALDAVHAAGWVHRDVTCANVIWNAPSVPAAHLIDFSAARRAGTGAFEAGLTSTGHVVGTPVALAPEQLRGDAVSAATDVYALGVLMHDALAGRPPFDAASLVELEQLHLSAPPPRLRGAPPALDAVVRRCLSKEPRDRYASAGEVARAVELALASGGVRRVAVTVRALAPVALPLADELLAAARRRLIARGCVLESEGPTNVARVPGAPEAWVSELRRELEVAAAQAGAGTLEVTVRVLD